MATLYDLKPYLIPYLNGVPDQVLEQGIRLSVRKFIVETEIWTELNLMNSVANQQDYTIVVDTAGTIPLRLIEVKLDDSILEGNTLSDTNVLTLARATVAAGTNNLSIEIALKPEIATYTYPDWLFSRYHDALRAAVLFHFTSMPRKPWSDPEGAKRYEIEYKGAVCDARNHKLTGRRAGNVQTRMRRWH